MKDVLDKYGIKRKGVMFHCPFHGQDKTPSAKYYKNSFYCFSCNKTGDLIQFVQYYFNISFQEAMEKINQDFCLGLAENYKIDKKRIKEIEEQRKRKIRQHQLKQEHYNKLCKEYRDLNWEIDKRLKTINILNWENVMFEISKLEDKKELLDIEIENEFNSFE